MPSRVPAGATPEGDGIVVGDGPVRVDAFIDFLCPYCRRFELSSGPGLATMLAEHRISLAYHPMNFLDQASTTRYSTRAAAASGCAADLGRFLEYTHVLFVNQPPEGSAGLSDSQLGALAGEAGLPAQPFTNCLGDGRYLDWPPYVTARAMAAGVGATPTVLVAGVAVPAESEAIALAVDQVSAQA
jgi:protein-disulfide isomerase